MKKVILSDISSRLYTLSSDKDRTTLSRIGKQGQMCFKKFDKTYVEGLKSGGIDIEKKISDSETFILPKEIVSPSSLVYLPSGEFTGYCMPYVEGKSLREHAKVFLSLDEITEIYRKLERIVKGSSDFVFPDLCSLDNVVISPKGIRLIDYDGMQTGKHMSSSISFNLCGSTDGIFNDILDNKKYCVDGLFTKNLDKKSLAFLYVLITFGINLGDIASLKDENDRRIVLKGICQLQGLSGTSLEAKLENMFFSHNDDEYIGQDVLDIKSNYTVGFESSVAPNGQRISYRKLKLRK